MAVKCARCGFKIKENTDKVSCPKCGNQYHKECYDTIRSCFVCYTLTPLGEEHRKKQEQLKIEAEKQHQIEERNRINLDQENQKKTQEKNSVRIEHLKSIGKTGYYEYKVISIVDKKGAVDIERLMSELNDLGLDGWRLQCAYTNEMGKDALSLAGIGINSTADQNILILERFVSIE